MRIKETNKEKLLMIAHDAAYAKRLVQEEARKLNEEEGRKGQVVDLCDVLAFQAAEVMDYEEFMKEKVKADKNENKT